MRNQELNIDMFGMHLHADKPHPGSGQDSTIRNTTDKVTAADLAKILATPKPPTTTTKA